MYNSDIVKLFNKFSYLSKYNRIYEFDKWNKFTIFIIKKEEDVSHLFSFKNMLKFKVSFN